MFCRYLRVVLLVAGSLFIFAAVFPVLAFVNFGEPLQTALMASKLIMAPIGAICFLFAAQLHEKHR